ncbi:MAG: hypothetical protein HY321_18560 [Armatimonadetes bacterium]|nr:hypothetical protein [Armatimonadota bacterium]
MKRVLVPAVVLVVVVLIAAISDPGSSALGSPGGLLFAAVLVLTYVVVVKMSASDRTPSGAHDRGAGETAPATSCPTCGAAMVDGEFYCTSDGTAECAWVRPPGARRPGLWEVPFWDWVAAGERGGARVIEQVAKVCLRCGVLLLRIDPSAFGPPDSATEGPDRTPPAA